MSAEFVPNVHSESNSCNILLKRYFPFRYCVVRSITLHHCDTLETIIIFFLAICLVKFAFLLVPSIIDKVRNRRVRAHFSDSQNITVKCIRENVARTSKVTRPDYDVCSRRINDAIKFCTIEIQHDRIFARS